MLSWPMQECRPKLDLWRVKKTMKMDLPMPDAIAVYFQFIWALISCCGTILAPLVLIPATLRDPYINKRKQTNRIDYSLLDISCLFVLMAFAMAAVRFFGTRSAAGGMIFFAGLTLLIWWTSIRSLSRANVKSNSQRLFIILGVTPVVWIVSFILPGCICFLVIAIFWNEASNARLFVLLLMSVGGIAILCVCRKCVRSIYSNITVAELEETARSLYVQTPHSSTRQDGPSRFD